MLKVNNKGWKGLRFQDKARYRVSHELNIFKTVFWYIVLEDIPDLLHPEVPHG